MTEKITDGIYRLLVPFEELTTTVYIEKRDTGVGLIDSATYPSDADGYIIPALRELGLDPRDVRYIALTHRHGDHAGGAPRLLELCKAARLYANPCEGVADALPIRDGDTIGGLVAIHLPGHTEGSTAFYDPAEGVLLSGDCLQLRGVGKYRKGVTLPTLYRASVERLGRMDVRRIVAAHDYDPLGSIADGREAVARYLDECLSAIAER